MSGELKREEAKPFAVRDPLQIAKSVPPSYPCLVENLLIETGVTMVCGKPKTGKSTLLRQLAVCVAEGRPFLGLPVKAGNVLFLNLEGPDAVASQHMQRLGLTQTHGRVDLMSEILLTAGSDRFRRLAKTIEIHPGIKLVVIDPVARLLRVKDNDAYTEVLGVLEKLEAIAKHYSVQIVFSTHGKKRKTDDEGDSAIGSTAYRGSTDTNIFLSKQGTQRIISAEQRCLTGMEPTLLQFDEQRQEMNLGTTVEHVEQSRRENRDRQTSERVELAILELLKVRGSLTTDELLSGVTGNDAKKYAALERLESASRIQRERNGKKICYRLAEIPVEEKEAA